MKVTRPVLWADEADEQETAFTEPTLLALDMFKPPAINQSTKFDHQNLSINQVQ